MPLNLYLLILASVIGAGGLTIWAVSTGALPFALTLGLIFALALKLAHARWMK